VGLYAAQLERYDQAIEIYEEVCTVYLSKMLATRTSFNSREMLEVSKRFMLLVKSVISDHIVFKVNHI